MVKKEVINILYHHCGGGHVAAAKSLNHLLSDEYEVRLFDVLNLPVPQSKLMRFIATNAERSWNDSLKFGLTHTVFHTLMYRQYNFTLKLMKKHVLETLHKLWEEYPCDLVLSVIPFFNPYIEESLNGSVPFVLMMTDYADVDQYPVWFRQNKHYLICPTDHAKQQALKRGFAEDKIFLIDGLLLSDSYGKSIKLTKEEMREKLGLKPDLKTVLILFGAYGSNQMVHVSKQLKNSTANLQQVFICGKNESLKKKLESTIDTNSSIVLGFIDNMHEYLHASDLMISKLGGGSVTEAIAKKIPIISEINNWTIPIEYYNGIWLEENQFGIMLSSFKNLKEKIPDILTNLPTMNSKLLCYENKSRTQVKGILKDIFKNK